MVFTDLPLSQEFKTLGMDDYLWVQALFNHEELERLRGQEPTDPVRGTAWYSLVTRALVRGGGVGGEVGGMVHCKSYSND